MSSSESPGECSGTTTAPSPAVPAVLGLVADLRKRCGVLKAKKKDGVKFNVRSADELNDRIRGIAVELGLLIYPVSCIGVGFAVEDGTLATVNVTLRIQSVTDGSYIDVQGFGLGADSQDKAGGKAGTYAWKMALVQTLLAGGNADTDDTDTPIQGGVRKKGQPKPTVASVTAGFQAAQDKAGYDMAYSDARKLSVDDQKLVSSEFKACRERLGLASPAPTQH